MERFLVFYQGLDVERGQTDWQSRAIVKKTQSQNL
jgi:hypothetical protein